MKEERYFYVPDASSSDLLPEEERNHALRVLRLGVNDSIFLMDGNGRFYNAVISEISKKHCKYNIIDYVEKPRSWNAFLHIAISPTKNIDRTEWFVEKAVEIGVDKISFINTVFTERKHINLERMERIVVSAMKQSRKPFKTIIEGLVDFSTFIDNNNLKNRYICHCYGINDLIQMKEKTLLRDSFDGKDDALVMIGPEGDFSVDEVIYAENHGFNPVSLGESRLRTETAALVALNIINMAAS